MRPRLRARAREAPLGARETRARRILSTFPDASHMSLASPARVARPRWRATTASTPRALTSARDRARARRWTRASSFVFLGVETAASEVPPPYVPSPLSAEDGAAQLFVCAFILILGSLGMVTSLENEAATREAALADKVRAQRDAMSTAQSRAIEASSGAVKEILDERGVVRMNGVMSARASEAILAYVDETLRVNDARGDGKNLSMEVFGNVYCKKNRWDIKLSDDKPVRMALEECVRSMGDALRAACGEDAKLVELAALVSDPGSTRQPVHPDTAYRRDPSVYTCFVALQDVDVDMGPTLFIPGTNNAQAHAEFREGLERGGPVLQRPNELGLISRGDATLFDSRTLHCGTENASSRRRVLFYFSFQRTESDNPNAAVSTIRTELRDKYTLGDLLGA